MPAVPAAEPSGSAVPVRAPLHPDAMAVAAPLGPRVVPTVAGFPGAVVGLPSAGLVPLWHADGSYTVHTFASDDGPELLGAALGRGRLPRATLPDGAVREIAGVARPPHDRPAPAGTTVGTTAGITADPAARAAAPASSTAPAAPAPPATPSAAHWRLVLDESGDAVVHLGPPLTDPPTDDAWAPLVPFLTAVLRDRLADGERVVLTYGGWGAVDPRTYVAAARVLSDGAPTLAVQAVPAPPIKDPTWAHLRTRRLRLGVAEAPWDDAAPEGAAALMVAAISQWSAPWTTALTFLTPRRPDPRENHR
ncbi:hypothetical protein GCM10025865_15650 [Paraoerskovia sediminicola]|uniref:Uncharacterized protein n=1 Tax=Paraoerskovia sediminicola TaxID=1138587 RepID=A0ABN6XBN2_9CELL|nr:hypothetical protein [Paraoerskovia sediminicola]BDZ42266.1 hypothetical protein GCM10025865_15650 [Paraoerskovia sediminicola]